MSSSGLLVLGTDDLKLLFYNVKADRPVMKEIEITR